MFGPLPIRILAGTTSVAHGLPKFEDIAGINFLRDKFLYENKSTSMPLINALEPFSGTDLLVKAEQTK